MLAIGILLIISPVLAYETQCNEENVAFKISGESNAHAAHWDFGDGYDNVCMFYGEGHECRDFDDNGDFDNKVIRLTDFENAHVERNDFTTPGYIDVCFGNAKCSYKDSCLDSEDCIASIKQDSNSQIGECDFYDIQLCCSSLCEVERAFWSLNGDTKVSSVNEEDVVLLVIEGSEGCNEINESISLKIYENPLDEVHSVNVDFDQDNKIEWPWEAQRDCGIGCIGDPDFYFEVKLFDITTRSEVPDLVVFPEDSSTSDCGDGQITGKEICDVKDVNNPNDDIFVSNLECNDQQGWNGTLKCDACLRIDTGTCVGGAGSCGNGVLNPGEVCDGNEYFGDINFCQEISGGLIGDLACNNCDYNVNSCIFVSGGGERCDSCSECDDLFGVGDCQQSICVQGCPGRGSCYYDSGIGEDCKSCALIDACNDYTNQEDCEFDRCVLQGNNACEWVNGACKENKNCEWDCNGIYTSCVNGYAQKVDICRLISGDCSALGDNPAVNYPDTLVCVEYSDEVDFPVFSFFNMFISLILLLGYYLGRKSR